MSREWFDRATVRHALAGDTGDVTVSDAEWAMYSAGYEAGIRAGIEMADLRISVELVPVGPANAGLKLWKTLTRARLQHHATYPDPPASGELLRERARASWDPPNHPTGLSGEVS